ncbi:hypothetical protein [Vibrio crassostreae]|uniref:hypothetical protein n=1 Tax=Vibrio crassostreae TaxID=246167 RepID=UPI001FF0545B|nr:hypothetical protein [Vibrio crassostreae]
MARITKVQWEENLASYNALILDVFLKEGWENVTYDRLSKETGLRKSTLQGYYPCNNDFEIALKGKIVPIFLRHLDFSSKRTLIVSWRKAMQAHQFRMVIRMLMMFAHKKGSEGTGRLWVIGLMTLISEKCRMKTL